jgi:4-amino-4-deoxy-L-arabinose transferase-like glycosyltransferase
MATASKINNTFVIIFSTTLALKLILSAWLPVTGDEAYFTLWGKFPDYGFYDHPPMLGWWLTAQMWVSDALWWLRLPTVLVTSAVGWVIYHLVRQQDDQIATWVASMYLLAPINLLGVVIANDVPLLFWSFLSVLAFHRAQQADQYGWYLLSGALLGLAFLSKFFAGVLGVAFALYVLLFLRRGVKPWLGIALIFIATLPAIAVNLLWNYHHCWDNYLFNLFNRTRASGVSLVNIGIYFLILIYAMTPPVIFYLAQSRRNVLAAIHAGNGLYIGLFLIGIGLFFLVAMRQPFGLHWLLVFYPPLFLGLAQTLSQHTLSICFRFMVPFAAIHVLAVVALLAMPVSAFRIFTGPYPFIVFGTQTSEIVAQLDRIDGDYVYATDNYTVSATAAYRAKRDVIVFGGGSQHGRQDDLLTDFRNLNERNILVLKFAPHDRQTMARYFDSIEFREIDVEGARYYLALGHGFRYLVYRDEVLRRVRDAYYKIPAYLPVGDCYMRDRYFDKPAQGTMD